MYMLYFLRLTDFFQAIDRCQCLQRFDFQNSIIATKLFLVIVLNLYLTSEWSQSKSDFVVAVL